MELPILTPWPPCAQARTSPQADTKADAVPYHLGRAAKGRGGRFDQPESMNLFTFQLSGKEREGGFSR